MTKKTTAKKRIPEFASIEEEAAFWDTHSTADYEDEFKPVRVRFAKKLSEGLTIRLDPATLEKVRAEAHERCAHHQADRNVPSNSRRAITPSNHADIPSSFS